MANIVLLSKVNELFTKCNLLKLKSSGDKYELLLKEENFETSSNTRQLKFKTMD